MNESASALSAPTSPRREWPKCPLCASAERETYVEFPELRFARCRGCGLVYKCEEQERLRPVDLYEQAYFHGRKSGRDKRFEHRVHKSIGQLRAALEFGEPRSMLDVGCSFGYVIEAGRRLGMRSAGTDVSRYAVEVCQQRGYDARVGDLERLPCADGEFDLVVMNHVLEHTPDPRRALAEVSRVLSGPGLVAIRVPDVRYWKGERRRRTYRYYRPDDLGQQHFVYYSDATLPRLLAETGFEVQAATKALFRRALVASRPLLAPWESLRFAGLAVGQTFANALHLRRELFVIARKRAA